jgi:hypothetical protein
MIENSSINVTGRELTPAELQTFDNAATMLSTGIRRGLSVTTAVVAFTVGIGAGWLIWGRKR